MCHLESLLWSISLKEMDSIKRGQTKRKSACVGDIFEVSDEDLSPEPVEIDCGEPETKVLKIENSDLSDSRQKRVEHNLKDEHKPSKEIIDLTEETKAVHNNDLLKNDVEICVISTDENMTQVDPLILKPTNTNTIDDTLEDGEVNDSILDEPMLGPGPLEPSITIKFDKSVAKIYMPKFLKFIQSFIELEVQNSEETITVFKNVNIDPIEWIVLDSGDTPCKSATVAVAFEPEEELAQELPLTPKCESPKKKKKKKKQKELFIVDTNPEVNAHKSTPTKYSTKFLINDQKLNETKEISKPTGASICFNCEKDHSLKDCPQPKNYGKISANRQKFMTKNKSSRYHLEEEQKYSHLHPGNLSSALRKALGLKQNQMPSYIYQMRILGYPPGWLEEAKVVESELAMFDIDGNNVKNTNLQKIKGLDPEKVVNYPGFNIPLEKEFKDEYKYYRVPPYSEDFSKEKMIDFFIKRCLQEEDDLETQDMDLDNTNDLIVVDAAEECTRVKAVQNKQLDSIIDSDSNNVPSPSLNDLETQKKSLLEELKNPEEPEPWDFPSEDANRSSTGKQNETKENITNDKKCKDEPTKPEVEDITNTICETVETTIEINISESNESRSTSPLPVLNSSVNSVKHSSFGTPIIKSNTPYNRLPNPDNFSKGVSPVIDFENLPNSTGKYEQMTGVLQKVRDTLNKMKTK